MKSTALIAACTAINQAHDDEQAIELLTTILQSAEDQKDEDELPLNGKARTRSLPLIRKEDFDLSPRVYIDNPVSTWDWAGHYDVLYPHSLAGLVKCVQYALLYNRNLRCLGARFSFSLVCETSDIYVDLSHTFDYAIEKHNEKVDLLDIRPLGRLQDEVNKTTYFHAPAGMSIAMINHILGPDKAGDKARFGPKRLYNMGGADQQTLAGAISTGTHGTGGKYAAMHDMVRSLELVAGDGTVYRLEPGEGITDPVKHHEFYEAHPEEVPVVLLQDDDKFYSALVSMGCFGIIYSAIIEVADMQHLHQDTTYKKYGLTKAFLKKISKGILPEDLQEESFYALQINPYKIKAERPVSYLIKQTVLSDKSEVKGGARRRKFWPTAFANLGLTTELIRHLANAGDFPKKRFIESTLKLQHDVEKKGGGYTDLPYKTWNGGAGNLKAVGVGLEFCIPLEKLPEVLPLFLAMLEQVGNRGRGYYLNSPITLRFARSSKAYLANNFYLDGKGAAVKEWCHVEILRVKGKNEEVNRRELEIFAHIQNFFRGFDARPHWGLNFQYEFSMELLQKLYPKFEEWLEAYRFFNNTGVFANQFTKRAGLDAVLAMR